MASSFSIESQGELDTALVQEVVPDAGAPGRRVYRGAVVVLVPAMLGGINATRGGAAAGGAEGQRVHPCRKDTALWIPTLDLTRLRLRPTRHVWRSR
jgi:hypothetical protein